MIQQVFEGIAGAINRRPVLIAGLILVIFCTGLYGMTQLSMQTGWKTYLDQDSPKGMIQSAYDKDYKADTIILIVEAGDPQSPEVLDYIETLQTDFRQQQNIGSTLSIVDILKSENSGNLPSSRADTDRIIRSLPENIRTVVIPSNVMTLIQVQLDPRLSQDTLKSTRENIESIVDNANAPPGVKIEISGTSVFDQQMDEGLTGNMGILIGGAMILMIITMGILFAYVRYRFMPVLLVAIGLVSSIGLIGLAGISLNMAVIGAFPVLIGLGIDYAIQFHARFDEEARKGSLENAVFITVTRTGPAVMYAMLATCMGFLAMFVSEVPMIRSFGLVAIIGIFTCYWVCCIGMPTFGLLLKYRPKQQKTEECYAVGSGACDTIIGNTGKCRNARNGMKPSFSYRQILTVVSVKIAKYPIPILLVAASIAFIGFQIDPTIPVESSENSFVPSDMPAKINIEKVNRILGSTDSADFLVQGSCVTDLDTVVWLHHLEEYELSHHPEITASTSIVTYILEYNGGMMPETQDELNAVLGKIPAETKKPYVSGKMSAVIKFNTIKLEMVQKNTLKRQMIRDIEFLEPPTGITLNPTGNFDVYTSMISSLTESKEVMTGLGFIFVFVFLLFVYRHLHAVSPIIPIILIVGWNAVAMHLLNIAYTPLTVTLGSMTIGVAAEYTILVMERYVEVEERLHDPIAAIQESVNKIGTAITISGLATFFGFSALCLSTFPIISNFGISTLIAVAFSLIGAIFIMPAVLSLVGSFNGWLETRKMQGFHEGKE